MLKINLEKLNDLTDEQLFEVFRAGFACLGALSPFYLLEKQLDIQRTGEVLWLLPAGNGNKSANYASIGKYDNDPFFIQFSSEYRKFNQLAAIQKLIDFGAIEIKPSDASDTLTASDGGANSSEPKQ